MALQALLRRDESECTFWVRDNGLGMTPEEAQQIFTPFYRVHTDTGVEGLGLGLSIVRDCAEAVSASIKVDSVPGEGTSFTITLPVGTSSRHETDKTIE